MRRLALCLSLSVAANLLLVTPAAHADDARLREAVKRLNVASETNAGYERDKFRHWVDANGDCQDTRDEVLDQESKTAVSGCDIQRGRWFSYYDKRTWSRSSDVDIDHMVALKEAWGSGAKKWNSNTRERYANDLGDRRSLVAVTDNVNSSKGDQDPSSWLPQYGRCRYVAEWTVVKLRWRLKVNRAEKAALLRVARNCANVKLHWRTARIGLGGGSGDDTGSSAAGARFTKVVYDPAGSDDGSNVNQEVAVIKNATKKAKDLTGWRLRDSAGATYRFPGYTLRPGATVTVHSGNGNNHAGHLYADWGYTWNNTGDKATLRNKAGTVADRCGWGDGGGTAFC